MMKKYLLPFLLLLVAQLPAQRFFTPVDPSEVSLSEHAVRKLVPDHYRTGKVELEALSTYLATAPMEFTAAARQRAYLLEVPLADGSVETFAVWRIMAVHPDIYTEQPELRTFAGQSLQHPGRTLRGSVTIRGLRIMVMEPDFNVQYLEPYADKQTEWYMVYDRRDFPQSERLGLPTVWDGSAVPPREETQAYVPAVEERGAGSEPVTLKVFRYGVSATGEFTQDHGGTKEEGWAAVIEYTNQVSAIFERDISLRLQIVQSSKAAVFVDPDNDPFMGTSVMDWMAQNPTVLATFVGENNYDVGHVYARYMGGSAIGVAGGITCTGSKGRGCSAGTGAYGDYFVNVIGQEVGHQMSGGHTWNRCGGGNGRAGTTAYEPGSGSTIMSYAGACGSDNVQGYSDLYFHAGSIEEIRNFYTFSANCAIDVPTDNHHPDVTLPYQDNFFIPIGTPFELDGSATDADGDTLSYNWEEVDLGPETPLAEPVGSSPLFRTWPSVDRTNRYFPRLNTVLNNNFDLTEQLPTITRDMTFRLTARDNKPNGGGVGWADVAFKATADAGPFVVTYPNTAVVIWRVGEYVNVTWDVANTDVAPVNCKRVNIRLSTDNGQTWPTVLASNVPNDGSQLVLVPNAVSNNVRVRIDAADNVFFDVSNVKFRIQQPAQPQLSLGLSNDGGQICLPDVFSTEVLSVGLLGYNSPVDLALEGNLPPGAVFAFGASTIQPGETGSLDLDLSNVGVGGTYTFFVRASSGGDTTLLPVTLSLTRNDFSAMAQIGPADGITGVPKNQLLVLRWTGATDATAYDVQLANHPSFAQGTLVATKTATAADTFLVPVALQQNAIYYWRVRPVNTCSPHDWLDTYSLATELESCQAWGANDLPKFLTANGTPTIESKITVNGGGVIGDVNVKRIDGFHEFFKDLDVRLISPQGTEQVLFTGKCGNSNGAFNFGLDDEAFSAFSCPAPNNESFMRPENPLSVFDGESPVGIWTLRVKDNVISSGGALEAFAIEFCSPVVPNAPYLVNNNTMQLATGTNMALNAGLLLTEDADNTASQLVYTLVNIPRHGHLEKNWTGAMKPGDTFTQAELNNGAIRYFNYNFPDGNDYFRFTVTDGEGGFMGTPKFIILPLPVGTNDLAEPVQQLRIFPNPATDQAWLALDRAPDQDARVAVFTTAGQMIRSLQWPAGSERLLLPLYDLPKGMYLVQVHSAAGVVMERLVRQ